MNVTIIGTGNTGRGIAHTLARASMSGDSTAPGSSKGWACWASPSRARSARAS